MKKKNIYIGWDIGGAHLKYSIYFPNSKIISKILLCELWKSIDCISDNLKIIHDKYDEDYKIINAVTMSGEMCDSFSSRKLGVSKILSIFKKRSYILYVYTRYGIREYKQSIGNNSIASMNWKIICDYLQRYSKDIIAIDIGSTTTDVIMLKNNKSLNKRINDFTGLKYSELIYTGVLRTPIFAVCEEVIINNCSFKVIPENFATMADIYRVLFYVKRQDDYAATSDSRSKSIQHSMKRIARIFGFDYTKDSKQSIIKISKSIMQIHMNKIERIINITMKKHRYQKDSLIVGMGVGEFLLKNLSVQRKYNYLNLESFLNIKIKNSDIKPSLVAPSYFLSKIIKEYYE